MSETRKETYTIPECMREEAKKAMAKYKRKADKYGMVLNVSMGETYVKQIPIYNAMGSVREKVNEQPYEVFDIKIESETIKKYGYTVIAKLEHLGEGNVVTTWGDEEKAEWGTMKPKCEHCGHNHGQKVTFIVRHECGEEKQVGKTCLKDYCGIDPQGFGLNNELTEIINNMDIDHYDFEERETQPAIHTKYVLALAIGIQAEHGYVKSSEQGSNVSFLRKAVEKNERPSRRDYEQAERIAKVLEEMDETDIRLACMGNLGALLRYGYCKPSHFGRIAYAPLAFERMLEAQERKRIQETEKENEKKTSEYIGAIGDKVSIETNDMKLVTSWETPYGTTFLYKFTDGYGNVFVWKASGSRDIGTLVKGTIKDHKERDGVKQTILTRCKVYS